MARHYAGIMGLIGLTVVMLRAVKNGGSLETAVVQGVGWMALFAIIGGVVGAVAQTTVDEAFRLRMEKELADMAAARAAAEQADPAAAVEA
ncbi:MAG: hypothetical protein CMJ58_24230 [Planctomycetaceae bacterium]|nr:hypothetical protein [Planctomycetaceae bacterium]